MKNEEKKEVKKEGVVAKVETLCELDATCSITLEDGTRVIYNHGRTNPPRPALGDLIGLEGDNDRIIREVYVGRSVEVCGLEEGPKLIDVTSKEGYYIKLMESKLFPGSSGDPR